MVVRGYSSSVEEIGFPIGSSRDSPRSIHSRDPPTLATLYLLSFAGRRDGSIEIALRINLRPINYLPSIHDSFRFFLAIQTLEYRRGLAGSIRVNGGTMAWCGWVNRPWTRAVGKKEDRKGGRIKRKNMKQVGRTAIEEAGDEAEERLCVHAAHVACQPAWQPPRTLFPSRAGKSEPSAALTRSPSPFLLFVLRCGAAASEEGYLPLYQTAASYLEHSHPRPHLWYDEHTATGERLPRVWFALLNPYRVLELIFFSLSSLNK